MKSKQKIFKLLWFFLIVEVPLPLLSQSLGEILKFAKTRSLRARIAAAEFDISKLYYKYYKAEQAPKLSLLMTPILYSGDAVQRYSYEEDRTYYRTQNSLFSSARLRLQQNIGLLGGFLYVDTDIRYYQSFGDNRYRQFASVPLRIGYSQSLLGYNSYAWDKRIVPILYKISEKKLLQEMEKLSEDVVNRYFSLLLQKERKLLAEKNFRNCDTLYRKGELEVMLGRMTKLKRDEMKIERSKAKTLAMKAKMEYDVGKEFLAKKLQMNSNIEVMMPSFIPTGTILLKDAIKFAKQNSWEVLQADKNAKEKGKMLKKQKVQRFAEVNLDVSVGLHQMSETFGGAYKKPMQEQNVSIGMTIPLATFGRTKMKYQQAVLEYDKSCMELREIADGVENEVVSAVGKLQLQKDILRDAWEAWESSQEMYATVLLKYKLGRWEIESLHMAVTNMMSAQLEYYNALADYWSLWFRIRYLTLYDFEHCHPISVESFVES